jgi:hypothetical protein
MLQEVFIIYVLVNPTISFLNYLNDCRTSIFKNNYTQGFEKERIQARRAWTLRNEISSLYANMFVVARAH